MCQGKVHTYLHNLVICPNASLTTPKVVCNSRNCIPKENIPPRGTQYILEENKYAHSRDIIALNTQWCQQRLIKNGFDVILSNSSRGYFYESWNYMVLYRCWQGRCTEQQETHIGTSFTGFQIVIEHKLVIPNCMAKLLFINAALMEPDRYVPSRLYTDWTSMIATELRMWIYLSTVEGWPTLYGVVGLLAWHWRSLHKWSANSKAAYIAYIRIIRAQENCFFFYICTVRSIFANNVKAGQFPVLVLSSEFMTACIEIVSYPAHVLAQALQL